MAHPNDNASRGTDYTAFVGTASCAQAFDAGRRAWPMAELAWQYALKVR
ncbi:hypothetical protein [Burkholderia sp. Ac-20353]|nr:hypothetical protein [Burkholderia sp. Ac-20353]MBN3788623.1 hypothetical protein [Burkholderia sp. Ac-20353]